MALSYDFRSHQILIAAQNRDIHEPNHIFKSIKLKNPAKAVIPVILQQKELILIFIFICNIF